MRELRPSLYGQHFRSTCRATLLYYKLKSVVAPITTACSTCHATNFGSTLGNVMLQLAILKFVALVEHAVVIRATTRPTCMNNVARQVERKCCPITWPSPRLTKNYNKHVSPG